MQITWPGNPKRVTWRIITNKKKIQKVAGIKYKVKYTETQIFYFKICLISKEGRRQMAPLKSAAWHSYYTPSSLFPSLHFTPQLSWMTMLPFLPQTLPSVHCELMVLLSVSLYRRGKNYFSFFLPSFSGWDPIN